MKCIHFGANFVASTMKTALILTFGFLLNGILCNDSESLEYNGVEVNPLYETIIYGDVADIMNEFDHNSDFSFDKANNESESNEDIDDLLTEYHHYLEKAHKQRSDYLEKNKPKNKVPTVRHEKFTKNKYPVASSKYNNDYKYSGHKNNLFKTEHKFPQALNPFNMFIPFNSNKYMIASEQPPYNNDLISIKKIVFNDENVMNAFPNNPVKSSCCKDGRGGSCKQCAMSMDRLQQRPNPAFNTEDDKIYGLNSNNPDHLDDTINVRIKVDVQLPRLQHDRAQFYNPQSRDKMSEDLAVSKEYLSAINLPSPLLNFPIPMNLFGFKKMTNKNNKYDTQNSFHKFTLHKKKKAKTGNANNKKHRKKVITFHNIKIEPELSIAMFNMTISGKNKTNGNNGIILNTPFNKTFNEDVKLTISTTTPAENTNVTETTTEENVLLFVNITNNIDNVTNDNHKTENSIETDYTSARNSTTPKTLHLIKKREISHANKPTTKSNKSIPPQGKSTIPPKHFISHTKNTPKNKPKKKYTTKKNLHKVTKKNSTFVKTEKAKANNKKLDKKLPTDTELLYWPNIETTVTKEGVKNITAIILEHEHKKGKFNMSTETMRRNHTRALEQAIFGNVNWNDVETIAPAFISFIGKYTEGILTFCNDSTCHSMKCSNQKCLHRTCVPKNRYNKGHCMGSNCTDSVVSMVSIMDLPTNVAFEIVDILEDRMIGKLFGKITLCINSKCITFVASDKVFIKYKCTKIEKELDAKGHCIQTKLA